MKKHVLVWCTIFSVLGLFLVKGDAATTNVPKLVSAGASDIYVPLGFDDNDNVQVVIEGYFTDTCYKAAPPDVEQKGSEVIVHPKAWSYHMENVVCLPMMVHYKKVVDVGLVKKGDYKVKVATSQVAAPLNVSHSETSGPDDYLYAPVKQARILQNGSNILRIRGEFTNACTQFEKVKVLKEVNNVISVLPIIKYMEGPHGDCATVMVPFVRDIPLDTELHGRKLFHIRVLNGNSVNLIEEFNRDD